MVFPVASFYLVCTLYHAVPSIITHSTCDCVWWFVSILQCYLLEILAEQNPTEPTPYQSEKKKTRHKFLWSEMNEWMKKTEKQPGRRAIRRRTRKRRKRERERVKLRERISTKCLMLIYYSPFKLNPFEMVRMAELNVFAFLLLRFNLVSFRFVSFDMSIGG